MTMPTPPILISLSAFGADDVRRLGQRRFAELAAEAGADGFEVRGELLSNPASELPALASLAETRGLARVFSSPEGLWHTAGTLALPALEDPLQAAQALAESVGYVHCKGVQRLPGKWVAVPLLESAAPWRAVLRTLPAGVARAIEYPLQGDDLVGVTRAEVALLRRLETQR
jgi:sugar phosphate isomerase/epimerase